MRRHYRLRTIAGCVIASFGVVVAMRRGLVSPGMHIPVILEEDVTEPPDIYYVLAWNFRREILANNQALIALARRRCDVLFAMLRDGTFYSPPQPQNSLTTT